MCKAPAFKCSMLIYTFLRDPPSKLWKHISRLGKYFPGIAWRMAGAFQHEKLRSSWDGYRAFRDFCQSNSIIREWRSGNRRGKKNIGKGENNRVMDGVVSDSSSAGLATRCARCLRPSVILRIVSFCLSLSLPHQSLTWLLFLQSKVLQIRESTGFLRSAVFEPEVESSSV